MKFNREKGFHREEKILTALLLCLLLESVLLIFGANILNVNHRIAAILSPTIIFLVGYTIYILQKASHRFGKYKIYSKIFVYKEKTEKDIIYFSHILTIMIIAVLMTLNAMMFYALSYNFSDYLLLIIIFTLIFSVFGYVFSNYMARRK